MTYKIPYVWYKNAKTPEEKKAVDDIVLNNTAFNGLFLSICKDLYEEIEKKGRREDDYKEAGILSLLAFRNGELAMLERIADLFNFKTNEG